MTNIRTDDEVIIGLALNRQHDRGRGQREEKTELGSWLLGKELQGHSVGAVTALGAWAME